MKEISKEDMHKRANVSCPDWLRACGKGSKGHQEGPLKRRDGGGLEIWAKSLGIWKTSLLRVCGEDGSCLKDSCKLWPDGKQRWIPGV